MLRQIRAAATDSLGNSDRRITELTDGLRDAIRQRLASRQPTPAQLRDALCAAMARVLSGGSSGGSADPSLTKDDFFRLLDHYQVKGAIADKGGLFDRLDLNENGKVSLSEIASQLFGLKVSPLMSERARGSLHALRERIKARSPKNELGCREFTLALRRMDTNKSGGLTRDELRAGTTWCGIELTVDDIDVLFSSFDTNRDGHITLTELMRGIRGPLPARRLELIQEAFRRLDKDGSGVVSMEELLKSYDVSKHPLVVEKIRTPADVLRQFAATWDRNTDGQVLFDEFVDYYKDVSALIERDDYFELMMRNAWHISGGTGVSENTTCRRVLVTFVDGNQQVKEIVDDLGIRANNIPAMRANLEKQGIKDIVKVEVYTKL